MQNIFGFANGRCYTTAILARYDRGKRVSPRVRYKSAREIFARKNFRMASQKTRPCKCNLKDIFFVMNLHTFHIFGYEEKKFHDKSLNFVNRRDVTQL